MHGNSTIKRALQEMLHLDSNLKSFTENHGSSEVANLITAYSNRIAELWTTTAKLRCLDNKDWAPHPNAPGFIEVPAGKVSLQVPFHLVPSLPQSAALVELAKLSQDIRSGDANATICLSGSTLLMRDFARIGDIDFCEYITSHQRHYDMLSVYSRFVAKSSGSRFALGRV